MGLNDYRIKDGAHVTSIIEKHNGSTAPLYKYVFSGLPPDRKGLIAAVHPLFNYTEGFRTQLADSAKVIAVDRKQPVFIVQTEDHWLLILFGEEREPTKDNEFTTWYDDGGESASDQFIGHYDPNGTWHLDSAS